MKLTQDDATTSAKADRLEDRYASALYQHAAEKQQLDAITKDMASLTKLIAENADFARLLNDPRLSRSKKESAILAVAKAIGLNSETTKFLGVLSRNRRLNMLPHMIEAFYAERARQLGETTVHVTSAQALSELQLKQLTTQLLAKHGGKINIVSTVSAKLIGGFTLKIGSLLYDFSLQTKIARLARNLSSAR